LLERETWKFFLCSLLLHLIFIYILTILFNFGQNKIDEIF
jgi:hypothetical protein